MNNNGAINVTDKQPCFKVSCVVYKIYSVSSTVLPFLTFPMDYGLINDETYPEADYLKKSMYGFGF